ncbi:MAG: hypothetical protein V1859_01300 [archaeon]
MKKKSEVSSQVFIYILGFVIIGITLIVGYKAIASFSKSADTSVISEFQSGFKSAARQSSSEWESVLREEFSLPAKYTHVCILDSKVDDSITKNAITGTGGAIEGYNSNRQPGDVEFLALSLIKDSVESSVKKNVFIIKDNKIIVDSFYVDKIHVKEFVPPPPYTESEKYFTCIKNSAGIFLYFKGEGTYSSVFEDTLEK